MKRRKEGEHIFWCVLSVPCDLNIQSDYKTDVNMQIHFLHADSGSEASVLATQPKRKRGKKGVAKMGRWAIY